MELIFPKSNTINFQVSQRGRYKCRDAFTDVAKMKKIKEETRHMRDKSLKMTLRMAVSAKNRLQAN